MQENSRSHRLTSYAFIASDILTFLIQSAGGALFASADYNVVQIGGKILLSGLVLQLASVTGFCVWMGRFDFWVTQNPRNVGKEYETEWNRIRISRWISIIGILV
jgi:RTA1 like protein